MTWLDTGSCLVLEKEEPLTNSSTAEPQQPSKGKMVSYNVCTWCDSMCRTFWKGKNYGDRRPIGEQED